MTRASRYQIERAIRIIRDSDDQDDISDVIRLLERHNVIPKGDESPVGYEIVVASDNHPIGKIKWITGYPEYGLRFPHMYGAGVVVKCWDHITGVKPGLQYWQWSKLNDDQPMEFRAKMASTIAFIDLKEATEDEYGTVEYTKNILSYAENLIKLDSWELVMKFTDAMERNRYTVNDSIVHSMVPDFEGSLRKVVVLDSFGEIPGDDVYAKYKVVGDSVSRHGIYGMANEFGARIYTMAWGLLHRLLGINNDYSVRELGLVREYFHNSPVLNSEET